LSSSQTESPLGPHSKTLQNSPFLEAQERSERYARVVVRGTSEVHLISRFQTETDGAKMPLRTQGRIKHRAHIIRAQIVNGTHEPGEACRPRIQLEINEAPFNC